MVSRNINYCTNVSLELCKQRFVTQKLLCCKTSAERVCKYVLNITFLKSHTFTMKWITHMFMDIGCDCTYRYNIKIPLL